MTTSDDGALAGRRVLVPVATGRERALVGHLQALGATVTTAALAQIAPAADQEAVTTAIDRIAAGGFAWLAVTSSHAVDALEAAAHAESRRGWVGHGEVGHVEVGHGAGGHGAVGHGAVGHREVEHREVEHREVEPGGLAGAVRAGRGAASGSTRVAAVGPATARALAAVGIDADLLPAGERSARGLLDAWPDPTGAGRDVLLAQGDLAEPVLADGLAARGWRPTAVVVYRNLPAPPLDPTLLTDLAKGAFDAVLLTSGSVAHRLFAQLREHVEPTGATDAPEPSWAGFAGGARFVALGPRTAEVLSRSGVTVAATSEGPDAESVTLAIRTAVGRAEDHETPTSHGTATLGATPPTEEPA